jgi:hypothetical protein
MQIWRFDICRIANIIEAIVPRLMLLNPLELAENARKLVVLDSAEQLTTIVRRCAEA